MMRLRWIALLATLLAASAAWPATLERLVMPGPVIAGHQEIEDECGECHAAFSRSEQRTLCLDCHERIAEDLKTGQGFHAAEPQASRDECRTCHTEHRGRDADVIGLIPELFDHAFTDFALEGPHADATCKSCHADAPYFEAPHECIGCHESDDVHRTNLGRDCGSCHSVGLWRDAEFDHDETDFSLLGKHAEAQCSACHIDQVYESTSQECVDCHRADDVHGGGRGDECGDCHAESDWSDTDFEHERETGFALLGAHADLTCGNCHLPDMSLDQPPDDCVGCHSGDDVHLGRNGTDCQGCHNQRQWSLAFDHLAETGLALSGAHAELQCTDCHVGALTDELPTDCEGCHRTDDPHAGSLPECAGCHGEAAWLGDIRFHHDLTSFALVGMHRSASCEQCHDGLAFSGVDEDCFSCHRDDDVHEGSLGAECGACHAAVGWEFWSFDHDEQTDYPLTGAHADLECAACHRPGDASAPERRCIACHLRDDVHRGSFGRNCDQCHATQTFSEPKLDG